MNTIYKFLACHTLPIQSTEKARSFGALHLVERISRNVGVCDDLCDMPKTTIQSKEENLMLCLLSCRGRRTTINELYQRKDDQYLIITASISLVLFTKLALREFHSLGSEFSAL